MLTFKTYLSDRSHFIKFGETARELARKTNDPAGFIIDFAEVYYPHLHGPLLEAFYLEADPAAAPATPTAAPTPAPAPAPAAAAAPEATPETPAKPRPAQQKVPTGGVLDWLKDLFTGGGAKKNFEKAMTALNKVQSVVGILNIPGDLKQEGQPLAEFDDFVKNLEGVLTQMKQMGDQSQTLDIADAIQRDPNYVKELQGNPQVQQAVAAHAAEKEAEAAPVAGSAAAPVAAPAATATPTPTAPPAKKPTPPSEDDYDYRSHYVPKGNLFAEALVLAGVPAKRKKTR